MGGCCNIEIVMFQILQLIGFYLWSFEYQKIIEINTACKTIKQKGVGYILLVFIMDWIFAYFFYLPCANSHVERLHTSLIPE